MFDSCQTLLPAEELKKRFEQEGKVFHHHLHLKNEFHKLILYKAVVRSQGFLVQTSHWTSLLWPRVGLA